MVKTYPIQEHELEALNDLNVNTTLWASIGSSALMLVIGCVWDMMQLPDGTPPTERAKGFMAVCAIIALVAYGLALSFSRRKKTRLQKILDECQS